MPLSHLVDTCFVEKYMKIHVWNGLGTYLSYVTFNAIFVGNVLTIFEVFYKNYSICEKYKIKRVKCYVSRKIKALFIVKNSPTVTDAIYN